MKAKKILIVDDEPHIRLLLEQALEELEEAGIILLSATDGVQAVDLIIAEHPDLVFLDIMLPAMSGFDACARIKKELKMDDVYIILLTAKGQEFDKRKGFEVGADQYMTKPFDPDLLLEKAKEVLGLGKPQA